MRAFVFTDKALERQAGRFVWLSINTEKRENAPFLAKYPVEGLAVVLRHRPGLREDRPPLGGRRDGAADRARPGRRRAGGAAARPRRGRLSRTRTGLYAEGKYAEAAAAYRKALETHEARRAVLRAHGRVASLRALDPGQNGRRARRSRGTPTRISRSTPSAANVAGSGLDCALEMKDGDPQKAELVAALAADAREVVSGAKAGLAADDVSALLGSLADEREAAKDPAGRKKVPRAVGGVPRGRGREGEDARGARPSSTRTGRPSTSRSASPSASIPMLEQSERDFPDDYNPPARLALAYGAMKKYDEALAASDRAMARAYGPRKLVVYRTRVDISRRRAMPRRRRRRSPRRSRTPRPSRRSR